MPTFTTSFSGVDRLHDIIDALPEKLNQAVEAGLFQFGERLMTKSKERCPRDTGTLEDSGHVELPERNGNVISVSLGYGGAASGYALFVHENMNPRVHWQKPGSGPKYLEQPAREMEAEFPDAMAAAIKERLSDLG